MSKPRSTLPNPVESDGNLASALVQIPFGCVCLVGVGDHPGVGLHGLPGSRPLTSLPSARYSNKFAGRLRDRSGGGLPFYLPRVHQIGVFQRATGIPFAPANNTRIYDMANKVY